MRTADPRERAARLAELTDILRTQAPPEDRDLVLSLAPVTFAEMPDRLALRLTPAALAARILDHFRFLAREMPPAYQLYKGLPGIHVWARNHARRSRRPPGRHAPPPRGRGWAVRRDRTRPPVHGSVNEGRLPMTHDVRVRSD